MILGLSIYSFQYLIAADKGRFGKAKIFIGRNYKYEVSNALQPRRLGICAEIEYRVPTQATDPAWIPAYAGMTGGFYVLISP